ncbi:MAG: pirin family protein [Vulcanococcus sp.]
MAPSLDERPVIDAPVIDNVVFRPAAERFHSQLDWLDSWHSFSFAGHHDPAWMGYGPLRVINDDTIAAGRGFGMHPHRDMEIITVMVEGQLNHHDSMGHDALLRAGEVQRMTAGTGIVHSERNGGERPCRLLQIWIEPNRLGLPPAYEQKPFLLKGGWTPLLHPDQADGALAIHASVHLWRAQLAAGQQLPVACSQERLRWIQMIAGSGQITLANHQAPVPLQRGDGLGFGGASASAAPMEAFLSGPEGADLLLFDL